MTASEQPTGSGDIVIAISRDDHWAHAYEDERTALGVRTFGRSGQDPSDIEFFDVSGRSLTPEFGPDGELTGLQAGSSSADPDTVHRRLRAVVAYAGDYLSQQPAEVAEVLQHRGLSVEQAREQLPDLEGGSLEEDLRRARSLFGPHPMDGDLQNRGSVWHNLFVHGMRT